MNIAERIRAGWTAMNSGLRAGTIASLASSMTKANSVWDLSALTPSVTGKSVTQDSSLRVTAVFACVKILAETVSSLPLPVYKRLAGGGKERWPSHPLYPLLHDLPNPEMTAMDLRENMMAHLCLWGNAYAEIQYDGAGRRTAIWPLRPDRVSPVRQENGSLVFEVRLPNRMDPVVLPSWRVWWVRGFGTEGLVGLSPIAYAREAVGLAMATEEYGARFFGNDSRPGGALRHPGKLSPEAAQRMKRGWEEAHSGLSNSHRVAVLEEGVEWQAIGIPPDDAQFLETRKYQVTEIARLFRVPPHMLADLDRATFSNIEHQSIEFVVYSLRPWLVRIEQSIKRDLMSGSERNEYFAEHLVDGLLRGDIASRYQAYSIGRQNGWLSADDVRNLENMNPLPGGAGKAYWMPVNMVEVGAEPPPTPARAPAPAQEPPDGGTTNEEETQVRQLAAQGRGAEVLGLPTRILTAEEIRAERQNWGADRRRIGQAYKPVIEEATRRILRRERADVMRQAEKTFGKRSSAQFIKWLETFYATHEAFAYAALLPGFLSLGAQGSTSAAKQIKAEEWEDEARDEFIRQYTKTAASRYAGSSYGQLRSVIEELEEDEDPVEALRTRFDEWDDTRPGKMSMTHAVRLMGAVCATLWGARGVTRLVWVTFANNCPYCDALDGRVVGIEEDFLKEGQEFKPEGAERPLTVRGNIRHAPAHLGCDCSVAPE